MSQDRETEVVSRNLQTYLELARALNLFAPRKELTVDDLAKEAKVSWITAKKAIHFFHSLQPILPSISITDQGGFQILEKPSPWSAIRALTPETRVLAKLAMLRVSEPKRAIYLTDTLSKEEIESLPRLVAEGMLASLEDGRYFLSSRGIAIGATGLRQIMEMGIEIPPPSQIREMVPIANKSDIDIVMTGKTKSLRDEALLAQALSLEFLKRLDVTRKESRPVEQIIKELQSSLELWDKPDWPHYYAKALVEYAANAAKRSPEESRKRLQQAAEILRRVGAKRDLEDVEHRLSTYA